uniref:Small ribosomal subunit protein uS17c n=1 Tax=Laurenciella marilzae TaxID=1413812 RepID=A0A1Z1M193_9FLOR|nr:ribosomal protein S17 [Laurenciella marilzae]ARW59839.1 ribosomal protein S17 [Laurenciella marilzae]
MPKKETFGTVVSNKMNKTAIVIETKPKAHKKYGKIISKTNRYYVDDPHNECKIGDKVQIEETRPLSKHKRWKIKQLMKS